MGNINREELYLGALVNGLGLNLNLPKSISDNYKKDNEFIKKAGLWAAETEKISLSNEDLLYSIFGEILVNKKKPDSKNYTYPVKPLSLEEHIFPTTQRPNRSDFSNNLKELQEIVKNLPNANFQVFSETLYFVLKKYLSCLPVNSSLNYINLFEYLKVRAAIAQSLFDFNIGTEKGSEKMPLLLACADISGIQDFIYNITSKKASKSLKGRSFYLQLLMESITRKIISETNTTIGHILYSSGGKMYMILPNTEDVKAKLAAIEKEIIKQVYEEHKMRLYVLMDFVEFGYDDKQELIVDGELKENLGELWNGLTKKTAKKKNQKFRDLYLNQFDKFFAAEGTDGFDTSDGKITTCDVTGERIEKKSINKVEEESDIYVTPVVKRQWELGTRLQDLKYFSTHIGAKSISTNAEKYAENPIKLGFFHYVKETRDFIDEISKNKNLHSLNNVLLKRVNGVDFFFNSTEIKGINAAYGFIFYGGNNQAVHLNEFGHPITRKGRPLIKDFEDLADHNDDTKHKGFHRLGILRMDVDGLGGIFQHGLKCTQSLAAYSTLSAQLDLFFSGYLNTIRDSDKYKDNVNILYSGGDDLFVIGKWDLVVDFAEEIRNKFKKFVCNRDDISISGGISLVTPKFPIAKAAEMAGEEEKKAKGYKKDKNSAEEDKNALAFLGVARSWDYDFGLVKEYKKRFVELINQKKINRSLLQKLIRHSQSQKDYEEKQAKGQFSAPSWIWMTVYDLSQAASRKKDDVIKKVIKEISQNIFTNKYNNESLKNKSKHHFLQLIAVAARWAELELRMKNKN
jgi:CRISPR-associated protein Csm1